jgi:dihydroorotate dehydrogenase
MQAAWRSTPLLRPAIFALDAERAHRLTIAALKAKPAGRPAAPI